MTRIRLLAAPAAGLVALLCGSSPAAAATSPNLGAAAPFAIASSTFTNNNTPPQTTVNGNVCFTTPPATSPVATNGSTVTPCPAQVGTDQGTALADLNGQACVNIAGPLEGVIIGGGAPGVFPPGCYRTAGAMNISANGVVVLNGAGTYIFRSLGAITTGANSTVTGTAGACANDVFWTGIGATTLGASSTMTGTIIDDAGISLGHFATLSGRALAFGGTVTTDANTISRSSSCVVGACQTGSTAPTISPIANQSIPVSGSVGVNFVVSGSVLASALVVTATSSDPTLVPQSALQLSSTGNGSTRSLRVTGADGRTGTAIITVTVTDPSNNCSISGVFTIVIGGTAVPTLSQWAMIALAGLLGLGGVVAIRRRTT